jgi:hypothetical protein
MAIIAAKIFLLFSYSQRTLHHLPTFKISYGVIGENSFNTQDLPHRAGK